MADHHIQPDDRCLLVELRRGSTLIGILPLVRRVLTVLGQRVRLLAPLSEEYNTHSDVLLASADDESASALVAALVGLDERWDCFRMARLLRENPLVAPLRRAFDAAGCLQGEREGPSAYVLDLPRSFDEYLAGRSAKFRNHLKRVTRKLQAAGDLRVCRLAPGDSFDAAYDALLQVERASWKHGHGTAITAVTRQAGFYRDLARVARAAGRAHLQWLTIDGRPVAYNLGYLTPGGYHYLKTSYDQQWRPLGPSTFLRTRLIEELIAAGVARFDFPGDPYEWESQWTRTTRPRTVLTVYPPTLRGRALAAAEWLRHRRGAKPGLTHVDPRAQRPPGEASP
jgi:CelD/BcsL family acetyltransferase involved in cellulose biosynthesis